MSICFSTEGLCLGPCPLIGCSGQIAHGAAGLQLVDVSHVAASVTSCSDKTSQDITHVDCTRGALKAALTDMGARKSGRRTGVCASGKEPEMAAGQKDVPKRHLGK